MHDRVRWTTLAAAVLLGCGLLAERVTAEDWPQWMGAARDNVWREDGILDQFPAEGPRVVWRAPVAGGYAGPAVSRGRVFVTDYVSGEDVQIDNFERDSFTGKERIFCLDEASGKELWRHEYPVTYSISYPAGPRCTPTVNDGRVYALGAAGHLYCYNAEDGKVIWYQDLCRVYGTKPALWGFTGHPLVDGGMLICVAGGEGSHVVAFDKNLGEELWRAETAPEQGYSPPTIIEAGGKRQLILPRPDAIVALDPETGRRYWSVPYQASNGSIIMAPVRWGNLLYVGGYSNQNLLLKLNDTQPTADVVWRNLSKMAISPVNVQPFVHEGTIYGFDQGGSLMAVDFESGKRLWQTAAPVGQRATACGTAFIYRQADRYWLFSENGELIIARLTTQGYEEIDRTKIIEPTNKAFGRKVVWCAPAFANRRLYVRNDEELICVDLAAIGAD